MRVLLPPDPLIAALVGSLLLGRLRRHERQGAVGGHSGPSWRGRRGIHWGQALRKALTQQPTHYALLLCDFLWS